MKKILNYTIRNEKEEKEIENKFNLCQRDCTNKIKIKNKEIDEIKYQLENAKKQIECITRDNFLKVKEITLKDEKSKETIELLKKQIDNLKAKKQELSSRVGGLVKKRNANEKLIKELRETVSKLTIEKENILKQFKQRHIKLSPKQYDQKITTVALQKAKLNSK